MLAHEAERKVLSCGIDRTAGPGVEVRCGYGEDDLLRWQRAPEIGTARDRAEEWRRAVLAKRGFTELADDQRAGEQEGVS